MSSTIPQSQMDPIVPEKPKLTRAPSLEKIRKFNALICSPSYFLLPSLLIWLKNSHTIIQAHLENTIYFLKLFNSTIYKKCENRIKRHKYVKYIKAETPKVLERQLKKSQKILDEFLERIKFFGFCLMVYAAVVVVFVELALCVYFLMEIFVPLGLAFLVACLCSIGHVKVKCDMHYVRREEEKLREEKKERMEMIRPRRDLLGERTISSFNLF